MGLRSDHISGTLRLPDKLPVVALRGNAGCNMISAINRGALAFMVFEGKFHNAVFIDFMKRCSNKPRARST